jgi:putative hemolysin
MKGTSSSKMVVYQDNIDHITGFLHINDVMKHTEKFHESILEIPGLLREVHMVPETKNPVEVLKNLRAKKVSFAVVLDEYGGTAGLITINAIMKKIIGACIEESSRKEKQIVHIRPGEIVVNGNVLLREIKDHFAINGEWSNEEDTVASFLLEQFDKIPQSGEKISALGLTWEVVELKTHSISRVKIKGMLK